MIARRHLSRRTLLRGIGAAVGLPMLDAMTPAFAQSAGSERSPIRLAVAYCPNGMDMPRWTPAVEGRAFELSAILEPLAPFKDDLCVLSGLAHHQALALGDGGGDHARAGAVYLTGVHPKKTDGADVRSGISFDQVAARKIGRETKLASLELSTEDGRIAGECDSRYSCVYTNNLSWSSPTTPNPPEINPRLVFERLFGTSAAGEDPAARARRAGYEKSILDCVSEDAKSLEKKLGPPDRRRLDEYFTAVREVERQIEFTARRGAERADVAPSMAKPVGIPMDFQEHTRLMFDLQVIAFETDSTRIATFMLGKEESERTYREIGVPDSHQGISDRKSVV